VVFRLSPPGHISQKDLPGHFLHRMNTLVLIAVTVDLSAGAEEIGQCTAKADAPNILLILADAVGFSDLGRYGSEIATPTFDTFAAGGLRLTRFCNSARCSPARVNAFAAAWDEWAVRCGVKDKPSQPGGKKKGRTTSPQGG
jgi:hypothetical protein